jgi:hypothetical protein
LHLRWKLLRFESNPFCSIAPCGHGEAVSTPVEAKKTHDGPKTVVGDLAGVSSRLRRRLKRVAVPNKKAHDSVNTVVGPFAGFPPGYLAGGNGISGAVDCSTWGKDSTAGKNVKVPNNTRWRGDSFRLLP